MYWFACLRTRPHNNDFEKHYLVALATARATNPNLKPILLLDGTITPILKKCRELGTTIIQHQVSIAPGIKAHYGHVDVPLGTFLRIDIPIICERLNIQDQVVLYTDCDVMFLGNVMPLVNLRPRVFAVTGECSRVMSDADLNAGVMVMNWREMLLDHDTLRSFISRSWHRILKGPFDQEAYKLFYGGRLDGLDGIYNWRPYWGDNPDARIMHFHGPKPLCSSFKGVDNLLCDEFYRWRAVFRRKLSRLLWSIS